MEYTTVNAVLESLSAELNTEVSFSSHLNQLVDKLNRRRAEQDQEISHMSDRIRELETKIIESEGERATLKGKLDRLVADLESREENAATSSEVIRSLQLALDSKQLKIEEQKSENL